MHDHKIRELRQMAMDELYQSDQIGPSFHIDHSFPETFADELARREVYNKHLFRPNTYLHKWWARRCGTLFRTILKQFVPENNRRGFYTPGGLEGKTVLDPMMGGGTTLHEAIRLGANVIGADIDPIPIVQARASLSQMASVDLRNAFDKFFADLYNSLGHYFLTECSLCQQMVDIQYTLHGLRKACGCREVIQIDRYVLRHETDRTISICPRSRAICLDYDEREVSSDITDLITKSETRCPNCGQDYVELLDVPFYARYVPIAIVATCFEHGIFIRSPAEADIQRITKADEQRSNLNLGPLENFTVSDGPKTRDLLKRNIRSYLDLFSSRQILYLDQSIKQLADYNGLVIPNLGKRDRKVSSDVLMSLSMIRPTHYVGYKGIGMIGRRPVRIN